MSDSADNNHAWAAMYGDVKRENARLADENARLRESNATLRERLDWVTNLEHRHAEHAAPFFSCGATVCRESRAALAANPQEVVHAKE